MPSLYVSDINECDQSPSVCNILATCSNTPGSFSCHCNTGYTGDGVFNCTGKINTLNLCREY